MSDYRRFQELAEIAVTCLDESFIDYVLVGGATIGVYGAIRSTEDLDFMIMLESSEEKKITTFIECLQNNQLSITKDELVQGLEEHSHITVFDLKSPLLRLDLKQIRTKLDYSTYNLRKKVDLFGSGKDFWISSPESLIVVKLLPGFQSEKDLEDVRGILLRSADTLDWTLLEELSTTFGTEKLLKKIKDEL
ncbi:MAG TPA: DUF6036 family nucleotidyltransferase [Candidatus Bathyarchaeia archaeon]|nr:DUF6036 family nucleotidyltransferase [Candidatus Bathyarchaeia archaeon]